MDLLKTMHILNKYNKIIKKKNHLRYPMRAMTRLSRCRKLSGQYIKGCRGSKQGKTTNASSQHRQGSPLPARRSLGEGKLKYQHAMRGRSVRRGRGANHRDTKARRVRSVINTSPLRLVRQFGDGDADSGNGNNNKKSL